MASDSLNAIQLAELQVQAERIVKSRKLTDQAWGDAWSGEYPEKPTAEEIDKELSALVEKVETVASGGLEAYDFSGPHDRQRLVYLKACKTLRPLFN